MHDRDGEFGIPNSGGNLTNQPIEMIEAHYPIEVQRYGMVENSGGPGRFRGAPAYIREYRMLDSKAETQIAKYVTDWRRSFERAKKLWADYQQYSGWANAPSNTSIARQPTMARAAHGAGGRGFTIVPSGRMISSGRRKPSKFGMSVSDRHLTIRWTADLTNADGQLIAPGTSGDEPVQSTRIASPAMVTLTFKGIGSGVSPRPSR